MPVAIMIGHHPMYYFAAATTTQYGVDEFEIAAALLQEDVELVKCRTVDLEVPAWAEIVLEGEIPPKIREPEGPFSEFQDYYLTGSGKNPDCQYQSDHPAQRRDLQERPERHRSRRLRLSQSSHVGADPAPGAQRRRLGRCPQRVGACRASSASWCR